MLIAQVMGDVPALDTHPGPPPLLAAGDAGSAATVAALANVTVAVILGSSSGADANAAARKLLQILTPRHRPPPSGVILTPRHRSPPPGAFLFPLQCSFAPVSARLIRLTLGCACQRVFTAGPRCKLLHPLVLQRSSLTIY